MKTIFIYNDVHGDGIRFFVVNGDYSALDGVYINSTCSTEQEMDELNGVLFDEDWNYKVEFVDKFPTEKFEIGDVVVHCGFY